MTILMQSQKEELASPVENYEQRRFASFSIAKRELIRTIEI